MGQNIEYQSGITGRAQVRFGGKIRINICYSPESKQGGLGLSELKDTYKVGEEISETSEEYPIQVTLLFDNLESIDILRNALDDLESAFKYGGFRKEPKINDTDSNDNKGEL